MSLHDELVVFDGLVISKWAPDVFRALRTGGVTAINASSAVWENTSQTLNAICQWLKWFDEYKDLIVPVYRTSDILAAKAQGRTGIVLSFQNVSPIEDRLDYLALYKKLGVGVIQLTYNTQNLVGCGCYESRDSGLSDFGREVVVAMNRVGIAIDLSHVGERTADDVITASHDPVVFSHIVPSALKAHKRNKGTLQLKAVADRGGLVGITMFTPFMPRGPESTVDDYAEIIEWAVNTCGEDSVGYGTDFFQGHGPEYSAWLMRDKGYARVLGQFSNISNPKGIERIEDTPNLTAALERRGWSFSRIEKVMGMNWLRVLQRIWHE